MHCAVVSRVGKKGKAEPRKGTRKSLREKTTAAIASVPNKKARGKKVKKVSAPAGNAGAGLAITLPGE